MSMKSATHCKVCNTAKEDTPKMVGKLCHACFLKSQANYYKSNKEIIAKKAQDKRLRNDPDYVPRNYKTKTSRREYSRKYYEENKDLIKQKEHQRYLRKKARLSSIRPPVKRRKDFETYTDNTTWEIQHTMFLNFDNIKDCPMEHLTFEYYEKLQDKEENYYKEQCSNYSQTMPLPTTDRSYIMPDLEYGRLEDGTIRFYPT